MAEQAGVEPHGHRLLVPTAHGPLAADVLVPGSKSIANRALVCAALAEGDSELAGLPDGDDTVAMVRCLGGLGVGISASGTAAVVAGTGGHLQPGAVRLDAGLAGTTSRFVTAVAALAHGPVIVDGAPPLRRRPMGPLHDALAALGAGVSAPEGHGTLPVSVTGPVRHGGEIAMAGDLSSQYLTALMLVAPLLDGGLRIRLTTPLVSAPYVHLTAAVMAAFGADGVEIGDGAVVVPAGGYRATEYHVEPDASSAGYPLAMAAVAGGRVTIPGLTSASLQGDVAIVDLLVAMGCQATSGGDIGVERDPDTPLRGIDVDMADVSDLVPTIAAVAAAAGTPSVIRGVGFIRAKESDRLGDLAAELNRLGADVTTTADGLRISPSPLHGATLATHHDHRLAMAYGVLGTIVHGVRVDDPGVVSKSWPRFWDAQAHIAGSAGART